MSRRPLVAGLLALVVSAGAGAALAVQDQEAFRDSPFLRVDPEKIVMSERDSRTPCGECHVAAYEVWQETDHAQGYDAMHRTESARSILRAMDLRVTKRQEALCMRCHYTVKAPDLQAIAGVSCESCHGPARDWIDIHNDFGPGVEHPDQEDPAHRQQRIQRAIEGGMLRPSGDIYAVAANCYECHTVPMEELVNVGGHTSGSSSFDLLDWSSRIRHNFAHRLWNEEGGNREPSQERKRMMVAVDRILKYEFAVRGMAAATHEGKYAKTMERRVGESFRDLDALATVVDAPELDEIVAVGAGVKAVPGQRDELLRAAETIRNLAQRFTTTHDGSGLAALDPVVGGAPLNIIAKQSADPPPPQPAADAGEPAAGTGEPAGGQAGGQAAAGGETPPAAPAASPSAGEARAEPAAPPELPGSVRSRPAWFEDAGHEVIPPGECESCHGPAEDWYYEDAHKNSFAPIINQSAAATRIANLYGVGAANMGKGNAICMNCHGMIEVATAAPVYNPVGCQSCHGPAADYLDPHQDGGNPQLGMRNLKDARARAENCSRCHLITDERLLAAGHPSGSGYDFVQANQAIEHWPDERRVGRNRGGPYPAVADAALRSAWQAVAGARPIPNVTVVAAPAPAARPAPAPAPRRGGGAAASPGAGGGTGSAGGGGAAAAQAAAATVPVRTAPPARDVKPRGGPAVASTPPRAPASRPAATTTSGTSVDVEPPPDSTEDLTTEELLLLVKTRLERLNRLLGRGG